jgi:hypothetical protein
MMVTLPLLLLLAQRRTRRDVSERGDPQRWMPRGRGYLVR